MSLAKLRRLKSLRQTPKQRLEAKSNYLLKEKDRIFDSVKEEFSVKSKKAKSPVLISKIGRAMFLKWKEKEAKIDEQLKEVEHEISIL